MRAQRVQVGVRRARYDRTEGPDGVWTVAAPSNYSDLVGDRGEHPRDKGIILGH